MKKINFEKLDERNDWTITDFIRNGGEDMELIKRTDGRYLIKDSNNTIITKREKKILEKEVEKPNKNKKEVEKPKKNKKEVKKDDNNDIDTKAT